MIRKLNFDFYRVAMPERARITFEELLLEIEARPGRERTFHGPRYPVRLNNLQRTRNLIIGEVARIRMNDIPPKMKLNGEVDPIALDPDQGLGETATFLYSPAHEILIFQKNKNALPASTFCMYMEEFGDLGNDLLFDIVFSPEAIQRMAQLRYVQRFDLEVAAPGNAAIFRDMDLTPEALATLMVATPRVKAAFSFSMGHRTTGTLVREEVVRFCRRIFHRQETDPGAGESIKLIVSGREDALDDKEVIDLLNDRMVETVEVNIGEARNISDEQKRDAILTAWQRRRADVELMFTPDEAANE
jgi:hypothetical protein